MATDTRDRLLDAALRAFATAGVDGTAITDLEEAAGLAPGSGGFYRYFATKDEVLAATVRREIDRARTRQLEGSDPVDATPDPRTRLALTFTDSLARLHLLAPLIAILAREHGRIPELAAEVSRELIDASTDKDADRLAALVGHDGAGPEDPAALGAVVMSALVGYHLASEYFGAPPAGIDDQRFAATLAGLVLPGR